MTQLYWHTCGKGHHDFVLLHGWGLNAEVWRCIIDRFVPHFRLHLVDLPGYGRSNGYGAMSLAEMSARVLTQAPTKALWLGWSMGGLVASQIALSQPERVQGLITVASSPCFSAQDQWPGIKLEVLNEFQQQLNNNLQRTIKRFLSLQVLGTASAQQDRQLLQSLVLHHQRPEVLTAGLKILHTTDLRTALTNFSRPFLRIYGNLDGLVPSKIATLLDGVWPTTQSAIIDKAAHAPFISHPDDFSSLIIRFSQQNDLCD
ncbi:pimeloyl-ACP methyl ester esterase BioH [Candidatus Fukatsuia endosymbiont of Tuberolachnus salignus]|uniref:pimeloyl-ACP methyl ester esterase BioH n=1 Tax=Candidatus Fukatsuia endosymbiont of Tuberolachnus salignus TaxID=3077957 RepID=UPI00313F2141